MTFLCKPMKRCVPIFGLDVNVCTEFAHETFYDLDVLVHCGVVQRRLPIFVLGVHTRPKLCHE